MTPRKAASVLPEPVGALISVCVPPPIASQALSCTSVGAEKALRNQPATAGWKPAGSMRGSITEELVLCPVLLKFHLELPSRAAWTRLPA